MMLRNERGAVLGLAIAVALLASIITFAVLQAAMNQSQIGKFYFDRTRSRYAAEAGIVWAQQRLRLNPAFTDPLDGAADCVMPAAGGNIVCIPAPLPVGIGIDVWVPGCAPPPCRQTIQSKVVY